MGVTEVSRRGLSLNDVNYDDTNTNVSPHIAKNYRQHRPYKHCKKQKRN